MTSEKPTPTETVFKPVSSRASFPQMEEGVLALWKEQNILHKVDELRKDASVFTLYEGPPTANGTPGIHHVLARVFKDIIPRFKTMRGYRPVRRGGWDTHGLPVELEVEKELGITTKREIEEYGIERFNALCRESVMRYVSEWEDLTDRIAFWIDMPRAYVTFRNEYIETGWWILKTLWERGLLYQGYKVAPHCPRCVTTLSSHEVAQGYKDETPDPSVYVRFPLSNEQIVRQGDLIPDRAYTLEQLGFDRHSMQWKAIRPAALAWTTTPWTLTANVALAVAPTEDYVLVESSESQPMERLIIAKARKDLVLGPDWKEISTFKGASLEGINYEPVYATAEPSYRHHLVTAGYVGTDDGTGIVHTAPAYGAEDQELGRAYGLPTVHTVDLQGRIEGSLALPGAGKFVKEADEDIMRDLAGRGLLYKREVIRHTYPFCWRCDSPLLYYAKSSWYLRTTAVKERLVSGNQEINWYPGNIKDGRFGEWLRNNIDWALSRERYWGTPLPIWQCASCNQYDCVGSIAELRERALPESQDILSPDKLDLHRPYVDQVLLTCQKCGGTMRRIPDVADAWFDSGAMPFAQAHVMSNDDLEKLRGEGLFPADYICEAVDQTRGWFYTLHALSTFIANEPSYRNVICLGLILDGDGFKMSKTRGNVVDPWDVVNERGADAIRWYMYTSGPPGNPRRFSAELVGESVRKFLLTLWNVYSFFVTYANLDGFNPGEAAAAEPASDLDKWILSELNELVIEVTRLLDDYNPTDAGRRIEDFVDVLSNWYVRRSRPRFWRNESDDDKLSAHHTLYTCLTTVAKLLAPFTPFLAEEMYQNLVHSVDAGAPESVHLADWPTADEAAVDEELAVGMRLAMRLASLARAARQKAGIRVRQPISEMYVKVRLAEESDLFMRTAVFYVMEELNVERLGGVAIFSEEAASQWFDYQVRPKLNLLGPKYGSEVGTITNELAAMDPSLVARQVKAGTAIQVASHELLPEEIEVVRTDKAGWVSASEGGYVVWLATEITPDLVDEGMKREIVHSIQNMRRSADFDIADRIITWYQGSEHIQRVMEKHSEYIRQETLSLELRSGEPDANAYMEEHKLGNETARLAVKRAF